MREKTGAIVFIAVYLGQFFFCAFSRVESWPFSDYRIFAQASHPEKVTVYSPYFELSDGSHLSIVREKLLRIDKSHFMKAPYKYKPSDYNKYIYNIIHSQEMRKTVSELRKKNLFPVKFVVMQTRFKEVQKHNWRPVYSPFKKYDLLY